MLENDFSIFGLVRVECSVDGQASAPAKLSDLGVLRTLLPSLKTTESLLLVWWSWKVRWSQTGD